MIFGMATVILMAVLAIANTAPTNTTSAPTSQTYDNFIFCVEDGSDNSSMEQKGLLYDDLDNTLDILKQLCMDNDNINCSFEPLSPFTLSKDREQQNDFINGQLEVFKGQLLLLDSACKVEECKANKGMASFLEVCGVLRCTLQPLSWKIVKYLVNEKCGCGPDCHYQPGKFVTDTANQGTSIEQLPSIFYNTVNFIDALFRGIGRTRGTAM